MQLEASAVLLHALVYHCVHLVQFLEHILRQSDLTARTHQIVLRILDLKVGAAQNIIIQEAGSQLTGQSKTAQGQGIYLLLGEGVAAVCFRKPWVKARNTSISTPAFSASGESSST